MTRWHLRRSGGWLGIALAVVVASASAAYIEEEFGPAAPVRPERPLRPPVAPPPPTPHVPELAAYLDRLEIRHPLVCGRLAVFPVTLRGHGGPAGRWWTADESIAKGILIVTEKEGGGSVPLLVMENRCPAVHVFVMAGEVLSGGKQTRTVRRDVVLSPGQRVEIPVCCVEARRWKGEAGFGAAGVLVPQSIQKALRQGADQAVVWAEVARNNAALGSENATGSLELGLKAEPVAEKLADVRRTLVPEVPAGSVGFIFADRFAGRAVGGEFFGRSDLAHGLLPKLIDAYAVDFVLQVGRDGTVRPVDRAIAHEFLNRIRYAGSYRTGTPGSGAGIAARSAGLVGDGVGLGPHLVHFGCQVEDRIVVPLVRPVPRRGNITPGVMVE
ncbi:MAG: hypothetical protein AMS14_02240 [Planctomycetes bacterium DG_20]|nr:MAG: hypothetical protein AMS14_02240 [Planctomycetes bacterium DG_20]